MNNRQAGRRRGRGGQQRQGGNPNQGSGNRIDNRARGNAAQLLEKYKNLARDAQMQGDRVNTEYYLQFADHYFRVLSETRSRFEEQNQQRRQRDDVDGEDEDFEFEAEGNRADEPREERQQREPRQDREPREVRRERDDREVRRGNRANGNGHANGHRYENEGESERVEMAAPAAGRDDDSGARQDREPRRRTRARRDAAPEVDAGQGIDAAILPPAFGIEVGTEAGTEEAPKKPRRRRVAKSDDAEAPAA